MYRALLPEGQISCHRYEHAENGIELFDEDDQFVAFVPYATLNAVVSEDAYGEETDERSIM